MLTLFRCVPSSLFALLVALLFVAVHMFVMSPSVEAQTATAGQIIISEFRVRGPSGANDEFIEIYNASGAFAGQAPKVVIDPPFPQGYEKHLVTRIPALYILVCNFTPYGVRPDELVSRGSSNSRLDAGLL
jgi:hypothetical protein